VEQDPPSFWARIPVSFVAPFMGRGWLLLAATGATGAVGLTVLLLPGFLLRLIMGLGLTTAAVGMLASVFGQVAQAALADDGDGDVEVSDVRVPHPVDLMASGALSLIVAILVFGMPYWLATRGVAPPIVFASLAIPYLYWPMALTVRGISGRVGGVFDVLSIVRGILAAPVGYLVVALISFAGLTGLSLAMAATAALAAVSMSVSDGGSVIAAIFTMGGLGFVLFAGLAYVHGVVGYLMGALVAANEKRFAFLT
jgi:hypothetical protein